MIHLGAGAEPGRDVRIPGMTLASEQWSFLEGEYLSSSISAALGRSGTYKDEEELTPGADGRPDKNGPTVVGKAFRAKIVELAKSYEGASITGEEHIRNIKELAKYVSDACPQYLRKDCPRFGVAAKALTLYLKYLWCAGKAQEPPHCPFDRIVIAALHKLQSLPRDLRDLSWTQMDEGTYRQLVSEAERRLKDESLARWELKEWQNSQMIEVLHRMVLDRGLKSNRSPAHWRSEVNSSSPQSWQSPARRQCTP